MSKPGVWFDCELTKTGGLVLNSKGPDKVLMAERGGGGIRGYLRMSPMWSARDASAKWLGEFSDLTEAKREVENAARKRK